MTSIVEICNLALSNIRGGSINSIDEKSLQAQQCKLKYPVVLDQLLRAVNWQFANKTVALAQLDIELPNWVYSYQHPADCLQINKLSLNVQTANRCTVRTYNWHDHHNSSHASILNCQIEYAITNVSGNRVIGANQPELRVDYRSRVTDPNLFDPEFIMALQHLLSAEIAISIIGVETGRQVRSDEYAIYKTYLNSAIASNLNEQYTEAGESEFVTVRM